MEIENFTKEIERKIIKELGKKYFVFKEWRKAPTLSEKTTMFYGEDPDGISEKARVRSSVEYQLWRKVVYERDNYTCQVCHQRGGNLEVHHIEEFGKYPEKRFDVNNGITLCKDCHKLVHKSAFIWI